MQKNTTSYSLNFATDRLFCYQKCCFVNLQNLPLSTSRSRQVAVAAHAAAMTTITIILSKLSSIYTRSFVHLWRSSELRLIDWAIYRSTASPPVIWCVKAFCELWMEEKSWEMWRSASMGLKLKFSTSPFPGVWFLQCCYYSSTD